MLAFLHTSPLQVETFDRLATELGSGIQIRHEVQERLLADVLAAGAITASVRSAITQAFGALAREGAKIIVCTCSTIGGLAETVPVPEGIQMVRIDRPMAEQAVASGRRIVVVAALRSTFEPTIALLQQIAANAARAVEVVEVLSDKAWPLFERGDLAGYTREVATTVEATAKPDDVVLLAQASMAPAAALFADRGLTVLSSPKLGVEAAIASYRGDVRTMQGRPPVANR